MTRVYSASRGHAPKLSQASICALSERHRYWLLSIPASITSLAQRHVLEGTTRVLHAFFRLFFKALFKFYQAFSKPYFIVVVPAGEALLLFVPQVDC